MTSAELWIEPAGDGMKSPCAFTYLKKSSLFCSSEPDFLSLTTDFPDVARYRQPEEHAMTHLGRGSTVDTFSPSKNRGGHTITWSGLSPSPQVVLVPLCIIFLCPWFMINHSSQSLLIYLVCILNFHQTVYHWFPTQGL